MSNIIVEVLGVSALAAFGIVGVMQWLKQIIELKGVYMALINLALCVGAGFANWYGVFSDKKISFVFILALAALTFTQLGYEGLVKPFFDRVVGVKHGNTAQ
ncbi:hypothetical protein Dip518_001493 [Parelusimicrobium proximum]|uniref:hypothetical protein n=1 Tax=Parelusimicrobium proximum TaxID=3228953 RepID=UPI003D162D95